MKHPIIRDHYTSNEVYLIGEFSLIFSWLETVLSIAIAALEGNSNSLDNSILKLTFSNKIKRLKKAANEIPIANVKEYFLQRAQELDIIREQRNNLFHSSILIYAEKTELIRMRDYESMKFDERKIKELSTTSIETANLLIELLIQMKLLNAYDAPAN